MVAALRAHKEAFGEILLIETLVAARTDDPQRVGGRFGLGRATS
jgi:hypothetical protein